MLKNFLVRKWTKRISTGYHFYIDDWMSQEFAARKTNFFEKNKKEQLKKLLVQQLGRVAGVQKTSSILLTS